MKKSTKRLFTILLVFIMACKLFAVDGVVTFVKGKVEVNRNNKWISLKVGDKVAQSEVINTGFQSEAKVKLMNNVLYLGPVTRVTLSKLSSESDRDKVNVYLSTGTIRSKVNRTDTKRVSYTVRTPIAVASVRGTELVNDSAGNVFVLSGLVSVTNVDRLSIDKSEDSDDKEEKEDDKSESSEKTDSTEQDKETEKKDEPKKSKEEIFEENLAAYEDEEGVPTDGSMLVGQGQNIAVGSGSNIGQATHAAEKVLNETVSKVTTASDKEAVASGGSASKPSTEPAVVEKKTGNLNIKIQIVEDSSASIEADISQTTK